MAYARFKLRIIHACNGVLLQNIDECSLRFWGNFVLNSLLESYKTTRKQTVAPSPLGIP
jgi:hypothetical protein